MRPYSLDGTLGFVSWWRDLDSSPLVDTMITRPAVRAKNRQDSMPLRTQEYLQQLQFCKQTNLTRNCQNDLSLNLSILDYESSDLAELDYSSYESSDLSQLNYSSYESSDLGDLGDSSSDGEKAVFKELDYSSDRSKSEDIHNPVTAAEAVFSRNNVGETVGAGEGSTYHNIERVGSEEVEPVSSKTLMEVSSYEPDLGLSSDTLSESELSLRELDSDGD